MPLSPPADRRLLHRRTVECIGYRRADGLFDIEGRLTDDKSYSFPNSYRGGEIRAGEPVHDMWVRLTLDADLLVHAAEAWTADGPYAVCGDVNDAYRSLAGVRIGPGWRRAIQEWSIEVDLQIACARAPDVIIAITPRLHQQKKSAEGDDDRDQ